MRRLVGYAAVICAVARSPVFPRPHGHISEQGRSAELELTAGAPERSNARSAATHTGATPPPRPTPCAQWKTERVQGIRVEEDYRGRSPTGSHTEPPVPS